ncbi:MAG: hypothetical protein MZV70_17030 [Desulfobacterales bacterium]|nr:hypothetical protein [Desulfobacterales bacterium]
MNWLRVTFAVSLGYSTFGPLSSRESIWTCFRLAARMCAIFERSRRFADAGRTEKDEAVVIMLHRGLHLEGACNRLSRARPVFPALVDKDEGELHIDPLFHEVIQQFLPLRPDPEGSLAPAGLSIS